MKRNFQILMLLLITIVCSSTNIYGQCKPNTLAFNGNEPVYNSACGNTSYQTLNGTSPGGSGQTFKWEVSFAGSPYKTVSDGNNVPISTPDLSKNDITNFILAPNANASGDYRIRRIVNDASPACSDTSEPVFLYYSQSSASISGGTLSGTSTACAPASGSITVAGHTGPVLQWESAPTSGGPWTVISNTTNTLEYTNLTESRCYRALVDNICDAGNIGRIDEMDKYSTIFCVTINSQPIVSDPVSQAICIGSDFTLNVTATSPTTVTYQWRKDGNIITGATASMYTVTNTTSSAAGSYDVIVTNSCGQTTSNAAMVTVNPLPTVTNLPANPVVCAGSLVPATTFSSTPTGATTYNWTNSNPDIGLPENGIGNIPEFTATNSSTSTISATITVNATVNGCTGPSSQYTITVKPQPTMTVSNITVCEGTIVPSSNFSSLPGANFAWTSSNTAIGLSETNGTGNVRSFTATNNTTEPVTSTITVTPVVNGCTGITSTYTITVNPLPTVTADATDFTSGCGINDGQITIDATGTGPFKYSVDGGLNFQDEATFNSLSAGSYSIVVKTSEGCIVAGETVSISTPSPPAPPTVNPPSNSVCEGATLTFTATSTVTGAIYTWRGPGLDQSGTASTLTITDITSAQTGQYSVTVTTPEGCVSTATTFEITVNPIPTITVPSDITVCAGTTITRTTFSSTPNGATFQWTNDNDKIGLAPFGGNEIPSFIAVNDGSTPITAIITVTPKLNECFGEPKKYTITVNPVPTISDLQDIIVCHGERVPETNFTSTISSTIFNWTISGLGSTTSGTGNIPEFTANNYTSEPIVGTVTVTPIANGCAGTSETYTIRVNPQPVVTNPTLSQSICSGSTTVPVTLNSNILGATLSWTATATPGISGFSTNGADVIPSETISTTGTSPGSITYTIVPIAGSCSGPVTTYVINVNPLPVVTNVLLNQTICSGLATTQVSLTSNVTGTTFSWTAVATPGINGFTQAGSGFIPSETITASSTGTITYSIMPMANGCSGPVTTYTINVNSLPTASISGDQSVCYGKSANLQVILTGVAPWSITYTDGTTPVTINGITDSQFLLPVTSTSTKVYRIINVTDNLSCSNTGTGSATVTHPNAALSGTVTSSNVTCYGKDDGKITITALGGYGNYEYSIDAGSTWQATPTFTDLKTGVYNVQIRDPSCVSLLDETFLIIQPAAPVAGAAVSTNITCPGESDGTITVNASGGYGTYEYSIDGGLNWQTNNSFTGLSARTYNNILVRDLEQPACIGTVNPVTITEPADLTLDGSYSPILCYGGTTTVTLIANGGTGALEYRLGTGAYQNSNTITGVSAGTHQFWVRDVNGCEQDYMVTISQPARLNLTAGASPIQCDGSSTVTLTADGGTENYQFRNGSGAYQASNTFNVGQGSYTFYVSDGACEESVVVNIAGQSSLTLTGSFTAIACFGGSSTVTLTANGGNGGYSFKADNGAWQTENTFTLTSGDHIFAVSDAGGCQQFFQMNIPQPDPLNAVLTKIKDASCYGTSTGSVSLSITGNQGTANITWFKDGQAIAAPSDLNALSAGAYSVQITDACSSVTSNQVIIEPSPLTVVLRKLRDADCTGANTGALELQITGGEGTVTQAWTKDGAAISTPSSLSALSAGTYRVTVQDNCSSVQSENIIIDPAALQVDFYKINDVQCNGNADGGIGLRVYNSIGTTTVSWFKNNIAVQPPPDLRKLAGGTYYVRIKDYCSEVITEKITISEPAGLITNIQIKQQISCYGGADGSAEAVTTGGTAPYRYLWSNDSKGEVLSSVSAGKYTVTVTDFNNCQVSQSVTLTQPSAPLTASFTKTDVGCFGGATGTATVTVTGGTAPYLYKWSTDAETKTISSLSAGDYRLTITDFAGCTLTENVTISQPAAPLAITFTKKDVACFGEKNGSVDITVTGGTAPYKYRWSNAEESEDINNLAPGSYTITVIDKNGCVIRQTVDIIEPAAPLKASLTVKHAICKTSNDGVITANVTGGTQPYSYQWKGLSSSTNEIDNLAPKTYELLVTDFKGCTFTVSAEVLAGNCPPVAVNDRFTTDEQVPVSGSAATNDFDRQNEVLKFTMTSPVKNGIISFSDDGRFTYTPNQGFWGTETFSYRICNTSGLCDDASVAIDVIPYTIVNLTPAIVNVREGKKTTVTATLMRPFKDDVLITIAYAGDASKDRDYVLLDQFQTIRIPAGATTTTQKITIAALTDELEENDESIIMRISATSDPLVRVGTGSVVIISDIYPSDTLPGTPVSTEIPPNPDISPDPLVSPNGDGQGNEFFRINNIVSFPDNEVVIFNRWGNEVFRVKSYNESDRVFTGLANTGMVINADSKLPDGVYYYLITTNRISGGKNIRALNKGYLILKR